MDVDSNVVEHDAERLRVIGSLRDHKLSKISDSNPAYPMYIEKMDNVLYTK